MKKKKRRRTESRGRSNVGAAEEADAEEAETFGQRKRGDEMRIGPADKQKRDAKHPAGRWRRWRSTTRLAEEERGRIEAKKKSSAQARPRKKPGQTGGCRHGPT